MKKNLLILICIILCTSALQAQEVLLPLQCESATKGDVAETPVTLPFFDDFSKTDLSNALWSKGGALFNLGYAQLPPTVGMATLDAFDNQGNLYATSIGELFPADTLCSFPIRLDSIFSPAARSLALADSLYLSFFYLPGGGYGPRWEGIGDVPEPIDSLIVEFLNPATDRWVQVWSTPGISADTLYARTGHYWQYHEIPILDDSYLHEGFRFRFRNYCSLNSQNMKGILSNSDQWNIDYVLLNVGRHQGDSAFRDIAFAQPASSLLSGYQAMPYRQYSPSDMANAVATNVVNLFTQELASSSGLKIFDQSGGEAYSYDGGYDNVPVFWANSQYQSHTWSLSDFCFPSLTSPAYYDVVLAIREGVSGDAHPQNDTVAFRQIFDNYYAYDDGTAENGYGVVSTESKVRFACRFDMQVEDTLTAVNLYFNQTYQHQNGEVRFYITVWDDNNGVPGNIIYKDAQRRSPRFEGLNKYVRYILEQEVICSGTIYVGIEQTTSDFINLGFDRNNDASSKIFTRSSAGWNPSILSGALMLRPYFGRQATLSIDGVASEEVQIAVHERSIVVTAANNCPIVIYDIQGRKVCVQYAHGAQEVRSPQLHPGVYVVRVGGKQAEKVIVL